MRTHLHYDYAPLDGERLHYVANPNEWADAWVQGAGAATGKWATNLQNTQKPIVERAVAQKSVMVTNFNDSVNSGRWENGLRAIGDAGIKAAAAAKQGNFGTGVSNARSKYQAFAQKFAPQLASIVAAVDAMPAGSIAASKARVNAYIDATHALKGTFK